MNNFEIKTIILDVAIGANISYVIRDAIQLSQVMSADVEFEFNGTKVKVPRGETDVDKIYSQWDKDYRAEQNPVEPTLHGILTKLDLLDTRLDKFEKQINKSIRKISPEIALALIDDMGWG